MRSRSCSLSVTPRQVSTSTIAVATLGASLLQTFHPSFDVSPLFALLQAFGDPRCSSPSSPPPYPAPDGQRAQNRAMERSKICTTLASTSYVGATGTGTSRVIGCFSSNESISS